MKRYFSLTAVSLACLTAISETREIPSAWCLTPDVITADRHVVFETDAIGKKLPILWGFDTAWNSRENMIRGVRFSGSDAISCARVSFQPWAEITEKGVLPDLLQANLDSRMQTVGLIGKKVDIVLNLDGGDNTIKNIYGGYEYENPDDPWWSAKTYLGDVEAQGPRWADLIDATAAAVEAMGYDVITASPLNEPDLEVNGTPIELFYEIAKSLKNEDEYPRFKNIRISGGNTLNNDEAEKWYEYNKDFLDEGNTHQLAGSFDTYAAFFEKVREDGKHATADELHNVMEAMVGVEYGMQTGIWWGTAELARGEFMKASSGERLGYAENRDAWSAAAVYRNPSGELQAFVGCSERQAKPSAFNFVSRDIPFFVNGAGPYREYVVSVPGDPDGAYQTDLQRNAEAMFNISTGIDIQPRLDGDYYILNCADGKAISGRDGSLTDANDIVQRTFTGDYDQIWNVSDVPETWGGDFSYSFIRNIDGDVAKSLDDNNWNLEDGGKVISYGFSGSSVQQWAMEYAGDGKFRIRNKYSALYLTVDDDTEDSGVVQREWSDTQRQLWRFIPSGAIYRTDNPNIPGNLSAVANSASAMLAWDDEQAGDVSYTIARAEADNDNFNIVARGITGTGFLDNSLACGNYRYMIQAEDAAGRRSGFSQPVEVSIAGNSDSPIARYLFNDSAKDESDNVFDIKIYGSETYGTGPADDSHAMALSSGAFGQLPYCALSSDEFSICLWFRLVYQEQNTCLFSTGIGDGQTLSFYPNKNGKMMLVADNGEETSELYTDAAKAREWNHVAAVVSDGSVALYVNGEEADGDNVLMRNLIPENRALAYICADIYRANTLRGSVSDLRIYNRALEVEEIDEIMSQVSNVGEIQFGLSETVAVEYYSASGLRLQSPLESGLTIVRSVSADGTTKVTKIIR